MFPDDQEVPSLIPLHCLDDEKTFYKIGHNQSNYFGVGASPICLAVVILCHFEQQNKGMNL